MYRPQTYTFMALAAVAAAIEYFGAYTNFLLLSPTLQWLTAAVFAVCAILSIGYALKSHATSKK